MAGWINGAEALLINHISSLIQRITSISWDPTAHYLAHNNLPLVHTLRDMTPVHALPYCYFESISDGVFKQIINKGKGKGKAVPLQAWSDPEGSRKLRFPDFMTTAQDVGKVVSVTHRPPLLPGNTPGTHFC